MGRAYFLQMSNTGLIFRIYASGIVLFQSRAYTDQYWVQQLRSCDWNLRAVKFRGEAKVHLNCVPSILHARTSNVTLCATRWISVGVIVRRAFRNIRDTGQNSSIQARKHAILPLYGVQSNVVSASFVLHLFSRFCLRTLNSIDVLGSETYCGCNTIPGLLSMHPFINIHARQCIELECKTTEFCFSCSIYKRRCCPVGFSVMGYPTMYSPPTFISCTNIQSEHRF